MGFQYSGQEFDFKLDVSLDATLVHAGMRGLFAPCAMQLGLKVTEAFARAEWLKTQDADYINAVVAKVEEMEKKNG